MNKMNPTSSSCLKEKWNMTLNKKPRGLLLTICSISKAAAHNAMWRNNFWRFSLIYLQIIKIPFWHIHETIITSDAIKFEPYRMWPSAFNTTFWQFSYFILQTFHNKTFKIRYIRCRYIAIQKYERCFPEWVSNLTLTN